MGTVPRPLLALVAALLALCVVVGFSLGILPSLKRGAAADEEEAPIAASTAESGAGGIKDAQPLAAPAPPPPKPKAAEKDAASDAAASDTPVAKPIGPLAAPPEAAPGAPPGLTPAQPKLPSDLPPT